MRITQVMIRDLACLEGNATVADAARLMKEKDIGAVLITDSGKLVGIVTERDLALKVLAEGRGGDVPITEIYTP
ncbi:MAG TPA: CBS domain-containing protein, partial [Leptospiraceae bacterium]|nr:CBS domain-containing protein [Leptospiraceae bacterium]